MEIRLLRSKMALKGDNQIALAKALDIEPTTLSLKMAGKRDFKQSEITTIIARYELDAQETYRIFHKGGDES